MLQNAYMDATICVDPAENEPRKEWWCRDLLAPQAHGVITCGPADPEYATEGYLEDLIGTPGYGQFYAAGALSFKGGQGASIDLIVSDFSETRIRVSQPLSFEVN